MIVLKLFLIFLKIGTFTFGGGYAMIPLIQQEVVRNGWLTQEELIDFIAISESTPGPFAVNVSTFVGMQTGGVLGALFATLGVILPSFIIILIVAGMFHKFQSSQAVQGAMIGLKGAVVGLIGTAVLSTFTTAFVNDIKVLNFKKVGVGILILTCVLIGLKKKLSPILLILISAVTGIIIGYFV